MFTCVIRDLDTGLFLSCDGWTGDQSSAVAFSDFDVVGNTAELHGVRQPELVLLAGPEKRVVGGFLLSSVLEHLST